MFIQMKITLINNSTFIIVLNTLKDRKIPICYIKKQKNTNFLTFLTKLKKNIGNREGRIG